MVDYGPQMHDEMARSQDKRVYGQTVRREDATGLAMRLQEVIWRAAEVVDRGPRFGLTCVVREQTWESCWRLSYRSAFDPSAGAVAVAVAVAAAAVAQAIPHSHPTG